jgi:hypothetical protein
MVRNRSDAVSVPVMAKSCGERLTTGTPTAAVPRISEPVISTVSGISSAWATTASPAYAPSAWAIAKSEVVPRSAVNRDVFG